MPSPSIDVELEDPGDGVSGTPCSTSTGAAPRATPYNPVRLEELSGRETVGSCDVLLGQREELPPLGKLRELPGSEAETPLPGTGRAETGAEETRDEEQPEATLIQGKRGDSRNLQPGDKKGRKRIQEAVKPCRRVVSQNRPGECVAFPCFVEC